jgi:hypothetical protein
VSPRTVADSPALVSAETALETAPDLESRAGPESCVQYRSRSQQLCCRLPAAIAHAIALEPSRLDPFFFPKQKGMISRIMPVSLWTVRGGAGPFLSVISECLVLSRSLQNLCYEKRR